MIDKEKISELISKHKTKLIALVVIGAILYGFFGGKITQSPTDKGDSAKGQGNVTTEERLKGELEALKKTIEEMKKGSPSEQGKPEDIKKAEASKEAQPPIEEKKPDSLKELEEALGKKGKDSKKLEPMPQAKDGRGALPAGAPGITPFAFEPPRLIKIDIPVDPEPEKKTAEVSSIGDNDIFLPAGSFASFSLTSGAYAPETGEQMPVSAVINKAFVGPNKSSIPLRGCLILGKARGNTGYKSAEIKPVRIACVWPNGQSFETDISGYITDMNGDFGLKGKVIRHSGTFFSTVGITSFLSGFSAGLARAQEQQSVGGTDHAQVATNIIGSAAQYGLARGVLDFSSSAKQFFGKQLDGLIPAVEVPAGAKGYVFITSGVKITGGKNNVSNAKNLYYDPYNLTSAK